MSNGREITLIGVKYCGGCNPVIDRPGLVREVKKLLPPEYTLTTEPDSEPWDVGIIVCGCLIACADKAEIRKLARRWIAVEGSSVDLEVMPEEKIAAAVVKKILNKHT